MLKVVLITGISGSGKSVALRTLEDAGYFCVDNLPVRFLRDFIDTACVDGLRQVAIAIDARSPDDLAELPAVLRSLHGDSALDLRGRQGAGLGLAVELAQLDPEGALEHEGIFANRLAAGGQRVAVNDDLVVVNEEEDGQQEWQQEDVQQIEAQQTTCANHRSAAQEQVDIGADDLRPWCCLRGANGHGHSPIGQLVPGQQVAAKAENQRQHQQDHAGEPRELVWMFITSCNKRP